MKERDMLTISLIPHPSKQKKQKGIKRKSKQFQNNSWRFQFPTLNDVQIKQTEISKTLRTDTTQQPTPSISISVQMYYLTAYTFSSSAHRASLIADHISVSDKRYIAIKCPLLPQQDEVRSHN